MESKLKFNIQAESGNARTGHLQLGSRMATTPMLVQTGMVPAILNSGELAALGTQAIKQSALEYWLRAQGQPDQLGFADIHEHLRWPGIVVGASGADQAYRWAKPRGRKKTGVSFHEPATGQQKMYTPQLAQQWQRLLGCDLLVGFARWEDYYAPVDDLQAAAQQTAEWLRMDRQLLNTLAPVVGGGLKRVRQASVVVAQATHSCGYALLGIDRAVKLAEQRRVIGEIVGMLPTEGLRYLPACGALEQVLMAIAQGMDIVDSDCAATTALHGTAYLGTKRLHLTQEHLAGDSRTLVPGCQCPTCQAGYSRAYLHQLLQGQSPVGVRLLTVHNLFVLNQLVDRLRQAIAAGRLAKLMADLAIDY